VRQRLATADDRPQADGRPPGRGTTKRHDGKTEVTYNGHPLYYYAGDSKPGAITGQGVKQFGAKWYVLGRNGKKIDTD
jgi:predicted lipoprotein with Yx(FWY)xxD motif